MITSTPLNRDQLRKSVILRDIANPNKSKKRLSNVVNQTPSVQFEVDDELERSIRRNEADIQRRLSNISAQQSPQIGNEKEIKEHFQVCLKMFAENKISSKNAWNLKIIDYMRTVLQSQGIAKNSLQVASTSLDASAKIYGIRVDDIHAEGLKLANSMARLGAQKEAEMNNEDQDSDDENVEQGSVRKKKPKNKRSQKATLSKDPSSFIHDIAKVESGFFQTRTNLELSCINNLFTKKLSMNHAGYTFILSSKDKAWPNYDKCDSKVDYEKTYPVSLPSVKDIQTCVPFANFVIDEWDPDQEDNLIQAKDPLINEEIVFDANGIPIPELDGSIHDLFANADAEQASSEEEEENLVGEHAIQTNKVAHIVDFRPKLVDAESNEYSFMGNVKMNGNKLITQVWAGPSHWKLKHVRQATERCAGQTDKQPSKPTKRVRVQPKFMDFLNDSVALDRNGLFKNKRARIDEDPCKCTLPEVLYSDINSQKSLILKPVYISNNAKPSSDEVENEQNVEPYNYQNPNDSLYCSQHGNADDDNDNDHYDEDIQNEEGFRPTQNFIGDNLIDAPETVENTYIPYALRAKKMDMKKLKIAVWKSLVSTKPDELVSEEKMYNMEVHKLKFSDIYKQVPARITEKMKEELSPPLVFVALLHLCNEQNLFLTKQDDLKDLLIEQKKHFKQCN